MKISSHPSFEKEFKKLKKKYRSLDDDLEFVLKFIKETPSGDNSQHWVTLKTENKKVIMKKRMMCRALRGASFRIIYYYDGENIELEFIEMYFKGNKENENKKRIDKVWKEKVAEEL